MRTFLALLLSLLTGLAFAQGGMGPGPGTRHSAGGGHTIAFSTLANGSTGGSPIAGSGTYAGTAPTSLSSATWGGGCSGSSTPAGFSATGGTWSATFTVPSGAGSGCTITIVDNLSAGATSPGVTISAGPFVGPGPGDLQTFAVWGGLRAYSIAMRGTKVANVCNVSDATCADMFSSASTGALVITTIGGSDCAVVVCTVKTLYDQTGNAKDLTNATIANRPTLVVNCNNSLPCLNFNGSQSLQTASFTLNQPATISATGIRTSGVTWQGLVAGGSQMALYFDDGTLGLNTISMYAGNSTCCSAIQTNGSWHNFQAIYNTTSSFLVVDGNVSGMSNPGTFFITTGVYYGKESSGTFVLTGRSTEMGVIPSALSSASATALDANQHAYWGI